MAGVREDQLDTPTPCAAFDLRMLQGHLVGTAERSLATAEGRRTGLIPHVVADIADGDLATRYLTLVTAAVSAWSASACLDDPVVAPWGEGEGRTAIWGLTNETLVHGWDIAVATGQPAEAAAGLSEPVLARAHRSVPEATRNARTYRARCLPQSPAPVQPNTWRTGTATSGRQADETPSRSPPQATSDAMSVDDPQSRITDQVGKLRLSRHECGPDGAVRAVKRSGG